MKKIVSICLILSSTGVHAALNKWVDADGQVHYSDTPPPPEIKSTKLRSSSDTEDAKKPTDQNETTANNTPAPKTIAEREAELKKAKQEKQAAADKAAKEQANAETIKANCSSAQQNLRTLQDGTPLMEIDASGERIIMDDAQRQQKIDTARQNISLYCK